MRLDYSQELSVLQARDIQAELLQNGRSLGQISMTSQASGQLDGHPAQVELRDRLGGALTGSALPGWAVHPALYRRGVYHL